jgi:Ca2+-transporting ATPase
MEKEYNRSPQEVLEELGSCPTGLTEAEAAERLAKHGPNKLKEAEKPSLLQRFLTQLKDPMLLILMAAAAVSAVTNTQRRELHRGVHHPGGGAAERGAGRGAGEQGRGGH